MAALEHDVFYRWAAGYLQQCYPRQTAALGPRALRTLAAGAVRRARAWGYESSDGILQYVHATFLLGDDLETAPELAWAREILDDPGVELPVERLAMLEDAIISRLEGAPAGGQAGN